MSAQQPAVRSGKNYTAADFGPAAEWHKYTYVSPKGFKAPGKIFTQEVLGYRGLEMSLNSLPAGTGTPFTHVHQQHEELYIFLGGRGQMLIDGEVVEVQEGSLVRVAPAGVRAWRNTGTAPLRYLVLQYPAASVAHGTIEDGQIVSSSVNWPL